MRRSHTHKDRLDSAFIREVPFEHLLVAGAGRFIETGSIREIDEAQSPSRSWGSIGICPMNGHRIVCDHITRLHTGSDLQMMIGFAVVNDSLAEAEYPGAGVLSHAPSMGPRHIEDAGVLFVDIVQGQPKCDGFAGIQVKIESVLMRWRCFADFRQLVEVGRIMWNSSCSQNVLGQLRKSARCQHRLKMCVVFMHAGEHADLTPHVFVFVEDIHRGKSGNDLINVPIQFVHHFERFLIRQKSARYGKAIVEVSVSNFFACGGPLH